MEDNKKFDNTNDNLNNENQQSQSDDAEALSDDLTVNFDELTEEEAKQMLKEVFEVNKELHAEKSALEEQLKKATAEATANKDSWYRCAAEFENFKKRNADARQTAYFDGKKDAITSLLIVGDSVDRALSVELDDKTREGVMLIKRQFKETLAALNVEEINPLGQPFDPSVAEAIATVAAGEGEQPNTVKTVYKKGYKLSGKMLRYAQVIVTQ